MNRNSSLLKVVDDAIKEKLTKQYGFIMNGTPIRRQDKFQLPPSPRISMSFAAAPSTGLFKFEAKMLTTSFKSTVVPKPTKIPRAVLCRDMYKRLPKPPKIPQRSIIIVKKQGEILHGVRLNRRFDLLMNFRMVKKAEQTEM